MHIIAFIIAYAKKHHLNYCIPTKVNNPHIAGRDAYRFSGVNYCSDEQNLQVVQENGFRYQEFPAMDNVCFSGFFQSWKYLDGYRDEILKAFNLPYKKNDGVISIHIRRSDYLSVPDYHPVVSEAYIGRAIFFFMQRGFFKFKVFSDDLKWAKENIGGDGYEVEFSEGQDEIQDMIDASCCSGNIGSNSSFSWWIHYLNQNKNKIGVFPRKWFGSAINHDISDLLPANTIML